MSTILLKLGPQDAGMRLSAHEFATAEFQEPFIYERVRGRLAVMSPVGPEHLAVSQPFRFEIGGYWYLHRDRVDELVIEGWVSTSDDDDRIPDICVYLRGPSSELRVPQRVPDLVFEFVSRSRADQERDYIDKRAEYHAIGVKEYVIVDRFKDAALVLTWQPGDYAERKLTAADTYTTPLLPGLAIPLTLAFDPPPSSGDAFPPNPPSTST
jgi:Uma2 family endonuclease